MGKNSIISEGDILKEETQPGVVVYRDIRQNGQYIFLHIF